MSGQSSLLREVAGTTHVRLRADRTAVHANLAPCLIFGRGHAVCVESHVGHVTGEAVLVEANWQHVVNFYGGVADVIYLENCPRFFTLGNGTREISRDIIRILESRIDTWTVDSASALLEALDERSTVSDSAIKDIERRIIADPMTRLSEMEASQLAGLERTTMLRRFKRETGMTFRAYKRWVALKHASRLFLGGARLGHSGLDSGFADAAHFSRQFRAAFGLSPTEAMRSVV
jgi:AraC-like DNA-binding protein